MTKILIGTEEESALENKWNHKGGYFLHVLNYVYLLILNLMEL